MFVTKDSHRHPLSQLVAEQGTQIWKVVDVELQKPWFVVEMEVVQKKSKKLGDVRTLLMWRGQDLMHMVRMRSEGSIKLLGVSMVSAEASNRPSGWAMHSLVAIWEATESHDSIQAWVFEKADGTMYVDSVLGSQPHQLQDWTLTAEFSPGTARRDTTPLTKEKRPTKTKQSD